MKSSHCQNLHPKRPRSRLAHLVIPIQEKNDVEYEKNGLCYLLVALPTPATALL